MVVIEIRVAFQSPFVERLDCIATYPINKKFLPKDNKIHEISCDNNIFLW